MIFNLPVGGIDKVKRPPRFACTGTLGTDYLYAEETLADGTVNWELAFLKSCSVTFFRVPDVDLFLVAGGNPGTGNSGGRGGNRLTLRAVKIDTNVEYTVTIGGSGAPTSAGSASTADSGAESGAAGGYGGWVDAGQTKCHATTGGNGAYAFGAPTSLIPELSGRRYAAGGGGGAFRNEAWVIANNASGGTTGGGSGGSLTSKNGGNGADNTGSGGGGRCMDTQGGNGNNGAGGSGIVILRNARA